MLNPLIALLCLATPPPPPTRHASDQRDVALLPFRLDPAAAIDSSSTVNLVGLAMLDSTDSRDASQPAEPAATQPAPFGTTDSRLWTINIGAGTSFNNREMHRIGVGLQYFIADDLSLDFELNGLYFDQPGDDPFGINLNMIIRYHFLHNESRSWTIYGDGGAGLLFTDDDVPDDGSSFNFTPQIGFGASFDIGDQRRLFVGGKWHHISNANTFEDNPAADFLFIYAMIGFEF